MQKRDFLKLRKSGGGTLGFLSLLFLPFLMPQSAGTSVSGAVMAAAGAAMKRDVCRSQHSCRSRPFFSLDGSSGPRVLAKPHCSLASLSILLPLHGSGQFLAGGPTRGIRKCWGGHGKRGALESNPVKLFMNSWIHPRPACVDLIRISQTL